MKKHFILLLLALAISQPAWPRDGIVRVVTVCQEGLKGDSLVSDTFKRLDQAVSFKPDIACLPEDFTRGEPEAVPGPTTERVAKWAREHSCYVICPIRVKTGERAYNSAVLIDRQGKVAGRYDKIHPTEDELRQGTSPGETDPPVFETDFGLIGIQICFDIEWPEGWRALAKKGAEIVFWPSAFAAGKKLNTRAWENQYCIVSSTLKDTTKIVDISGEDVAVSGHFSRWGVCAPVNLEKAFLATWPYVQSFPAIQQKYGRKIRITTLHEEEISIIESLSADVKIADVMKEFNLKTYREHLKSAEDKQAPHRV